MNFDLTPEQDGSCATRWRRWASATATSTSWRKAKAGEHTTSCGPRPASSATSASTCPTEYGGGGGGITELAIVCEELAAAGCPLLLLVVSPAIAGDVIARHGTDAQRERLPARHRRRLAEDRLRDHRARGGLQLPPARHGRPPRRRRLGAHRPQVLHLRRRRGAVRAGRRPHRGRRDRQAQAGAVPGAHRRARADPVQARHGDRLAGEPVAALPRRRAGARPTR